MKSGLTTLFGNPSILQPVESLNKVYETKIIISQKTKELVSDVFVVRPLILSPLKAKRSATTFMSLSTSKTSHRKTIELVEEYEAALTTYIDSISRSSKEFESITSSSDDLLPNYYSNVAFICANIHH